MGDYAADEFSGKQAVVNSILNGENQHFRSMIGSCWNGDVQPIKAFVSFAEISRGAGPYRCPYLGNEAVVIGIVRLKHADVPLSS